MTGAALFRRELRLPVPSRADGIALGVLLAVVIVLLSPALLSGRYFYERDIHLVWLSQVESFVRAVTAGSWPLWDRAVAFGQPLLANPNTQVFYPPTWLHLLVRPWTWYGAYVTAHLAFSAVGLYALGRRLGLSPLAAAVAGGVWSGSGPLLSLVNVWHHFAGAAWMPWVFLAADRALSSRRLRDAAVWGLALAAQALAGSPDMSALTWLSCGALLLRALDWRRTPGAVIARVAGAAAIAFGLAVGLAACQWLPTLDVVRQSARWSLPAVAQAFWSVHPLAVAQIALPLLFDDLPRQTRHVAALFELWAPFLRSLYLGVPALGLAGLAFAGPKRPWRGLLATGFVLSLLFALGRHTPLHGLVLALVPPVRMLRYPSKAMALAALFASVLAGMGVEAWGGAGGAPRARRAALFGVGALTVIAWAAVIALLGVEGWGPALLVREEGGPSYRQMVAPAAARLAITAGLSSAFLLLAVARWRRIVAWPGAWAGALAVAELVAQHRPLNPTAPAAFFLYRPEVLRFIPPGDGTRVYVWDYGLRATGRPDPQAGMLNVFAEVPREWPPLLGSSLGMQMYLYPPAGGRWRLDGGYDRDLLDLYPRELQDAVVLLRMVETTPGYLRLLQLAGVEYVVALHDEGQEALERVAVLPSLFRRPIRLFRVPQTLPRAFAVGAARIDAGEAALGALVDPAFDARHEVLLPDGAPRPAPPGFTGTVGVVELDPDRIRLDAELSHDGWVVVLDGFAPGWRATVDGQAAPVVRANVAFRAVRVPAGRHRIEQVYRPRAVWLGLAISAATGLAGAAALGASLALRRPAR